MAHIPYFDPQNVTPIAAPGRLADASLAPRHYPCLPSADVTAQDTRVNVTAASNTSLYSTRIQCANLGIDETESYTSDGTATQQEIADGLVAALVANPVLDGAFDIEVGTNNFDILARNGGTYYAFTVTFPANPSTDLTQTATTAAADAPVFTYGTACQLAAESTQSNILERMVSSVGALTGGAVNYAVTFSGAGTVDDVLSVQGPDGVVYSVAWEAVIETNLATTLTNMDTAIETALTAAGLGFATSTVTSPDVDVQFRPGFTVVASNPIVTGAGNAVAQTLTSPTSIPDFYLVLDPRSRAPQRGNTYGTSQYEPGDALTCSDGGGAYGVAATTETPSIGSRVYIETAAGATNGYLFPTASLTRVEWVGWKFRRAGRTASEGGVISAV